jgi:opacity protein-like surface antigen
MSNFFWTTQGITIDNFQLGYDNAYNGAIGDFPLTDVPEDIISFGEESKNTSYSVNVRPDIWLFPFIDLYGIFGYGNSTTSIVVNSPLVPGGTFTSVVEQDIATYGMGVLAAGGVGPVWLSVDANVTWNKPALLDKPTMVNIVGIRMGKSFVFKKRPHSNISLWVGTMFLTMQTETQGAIKLSNALPPEFWDKKDQFVADYDNWKDENYEGLNPIQKKVVDNVLDPLVAGIDEREGESIVYYGMDKQTKQHWNGLVGVQYQINKHWQLRSEGGVIGDRKSFLFSVNYRILGFKKRHQF